MYLNKLIFLLFFFATTLHGQQVEQYSLGYMHKGLNNPGAIGYNQSLKVIGLVRQQWVAFSGAPVSQYLAIEMPLGFLSSGIGLSFQQTQLGVHKIQKILAGYSYLKTIGSNSYIAVGINGGLFRTEYDGRKLRTPQGVYMNNETNHFDALLQPATHSGNTYTFDVGIYSQLQNLSIGISASNALAGKAALNTFDIQMKRHYFGNIGYVFDISQSIQLNTGVQAQWNSNITQVQAILLGTWNELYTIGATIRGLGKKSKESIGGIVGYKLNDYFQLFYSYEYNILPLNNVFDANHELALTYSLNKQIGKGRLPKMIYNPRYF